MCSIKLIKNDLKLTNIKIVRCLILGTFYKLLQLIFYFIYFILTAKLLERQIERERARKVDEVCRMEDWH